MTKPRISIVVAISRKNAAIGNGGKLLFRISDDLKRFKALTLGHPIIMGRKTFESIGHPLPERENVVVTRNTDFNPPGVTVLHSIEDAIKKGEEIALRQARADNKNSEVFIIGGGEIYKEALPFTDKIYLTLVESDAVGDVFFPNYGDFKKETSREKRFDEKTGLDYTWIDLER